MLKNQGLWYRNYSLQLSLNKRKILLLGWRLCAGFRRTPFYTFQLKPKCYLLFLSDGGLFWRIVWFFHNNSKFVVHNKKNNKYSSRSNLKRVDIPDPVHATIVLYFPRGVNSFFIKYPTKIIRIIWKRYCDKN